METELLTEGEVKSYITSQYEYLNLNQIEFDRYVAFILKTDRFRRSNKKLQSYATAYDYFESKFNEVYEVFKQEGYDADTSLEFAKKAVVYTDRKESTLAFHALRVINLDEEVLKNSITLYRRFSLEKIHAKKCYFKEHDDKDNQTILNIIKCNDKNFENKFNINLTKLLKIYPLTDEVKSIWTYLAKLNDTKLFEEFKLTREQMSFIYPTTKEELSVLKTIANLEDEQIKERYGITREELLRKHPLNKDTLTALRTVQSSDEQKVLKIFEQPKEEVLHLRTITTEMILLANQQFKLKRQMYSSEKFKSKKKGTNPNG